MLLRLGIACGNRAEWLGLLAAACRARREQQSRAKWQPAAGDTLAVAEEPKEGQLRGALVADLLVGAKNFH